MQKECKSKIKVDINAFQQQTKLDVEKLIMKTMKTKMYREAN